MLKKNFIIFFGLILFFSSFSFLVKAKGDAVSKIKENKKIKMLTNAEFMPFEYFDEKQNIRGIDIDISKKIAEKLGVKLETESVAFDSILIEVQNKTCDFSASGHTYTEEKAKSVLFSEPYFKTSQKIVVLKDSKISSKEDLKGKKIGVLLGYTGDTFCSLQEGFLEPTRFSSPTDAITELANKSIDAMVIDDYNADSILNSQKNKFKKIDEVLTEEEYAIIAPKGSEDLIKVINDVLLELKNTGEINKMVKNHTAVSSLDTGKDNLASNISPGEENAYVKFSGVIANGVKNTIVLTIFSIVIGVILGSILAFFRVSSKENKKLKVLSVVSKIYITVVRGTPIIVQVFIMCYVIFPSIGFSDKFLAATMAFGLNSAAYAAEIIRSGISSIGSGQLEASRSLGLSYKTSMIHIILPQAFKNVLPALINEFISVLKETSIVGMVGLVDLARSGDMIRSTTYDAFGPLILVACIYLSIVLVLTGILSVVEKRMNKKDDL